MRTYRVLKAASYRIDEIYLYSWDQWGEEQAKHYINGLFGCFDKIAKREVLSQCEGSKYFGRPKCPRHFLILPQKYNFLGLYLYN